MAEAEIVSQNAVNDLHCNLLRKKETRIRRHRAWLRIWSRHTRRHERPTLRTDCTTRAARANVIIVRHVLSRKVRAFSTEQVHAARPSGSQQRRTTSKTSSRSTGAKTLSDPRPPYALRFCGSTLNTGPISILAGHLRGRVSHWQHSSKWYGGANLPVTNSSLHLRAVSE